jgi:ABC-type dipeptide/oligopeptide/nickel transport system permease component
VAYLIRRLAAAVPTMLILSFVIFMLQHLVPGDPTLLVIPETYTQDVYDRARERLGIDESLPVQYAKFLQHTVTGDLGTSLMYRKPVSDLVLERLVKTLLLSLGSLVVCYLIGIPLGVIAALRRGSILDSFCMSIATLGLAIPGFWLGILLVILFSIHLGWLPATGSQDGWKSYVLPIFTLGVAEAASVARLIRSSMVDNLAADYIRTARSKGVREFAVVMRHAFRNALLPIVSVLGLQIGYLLTGAVVVETVFAWPGLGKLLIDSILNKDFPVAQAVLLIIGAMIVLSNLAADLAYRLVDPRVVLK